MSQPERRRNAGNAAAPTEDRVDSSVSGQPANRTAAADPNNPPQGQQQQSLTQTIMQMLTRAMMAYAVLTFFNGGFGGKKTAVAPTPESIMKSPDGVVQQINVGGQHVAGLPAPDKLYPLWAPSSKADMFVYLSEEPDFKDFDNKDSLVWRSNDIELGDWDEDRVVDLSIVPSKAMLTRYYKKMREFKVKNLIGGKQNTEEESPEEASAPSSTIVSYWHQNLTLVVLSDRSMIQYAALQPELKDLYQLESTGLRDEHGNGFVLPALYVNDFWLLKEQMTPINDTVKYVRDLEELPLRINFYPISYIKLQLYASLDVGTKKQSGMMGGTGAELDEVKRMLIETNPYLLVLTAVVSLLHSAFEMLAFKNDIAFWKDKKGTAGLSVRAIFLDIAQQIIVFAYLMDNNQETSYMILIGQAVGLAIELWKVKKALKLDIVPATSGILPYRLHFNNSEPLTDLESKTKEYDEEAFKYLSWAAFPMLGCYAIYSVLYQEHKSWYSFIVSTLVGFVYTFGFIKMTPQLFINYKLKSVAHMPFRTMMYKSLNTFIDDLFSFIIKMPMLHRLACLRDDVVFFVYLYQRYIYRTDHTRANEFGQVGDDDATPAGEEKAESKKDK
ncbi:hypothetical protein EDD11_009209 [Mortierella claussenii]|nr:hypothetical protein EDD11_009209 [Mortierella claussenii]